MKRIIVLGLSALLVIGSVFAGAKRIDDSNGSKTVTATDSATTTYTTGTVFDVTPLTNAKTNSKYDQLEAVIYAMDMVASDSAIGNTDTVIVSWKFSFGPYTVTAEVDTGLPPCTLSFSFRDYSQKAGTILGDSTAVIYSLNSPYLYYDRFWAEYAIGDSALAVDSTGTVTLQYWSRLAEDW